MARVPLWRNRDFVLLQSGQLLSNIGSQSTSIAYPLLVLALTHSASKAGVVAFARLVPMALFLLPAGVAADQWSRKRLMVTADATRVTAIGALAAMVVLRRVVFWAIPVAAFVEGIGAAVFAAAQVGAVRSVVAPAQLPSAVATQGGREAVVDLAGQPLGGVLFAIDRALPFVVDAFSYAFAMVSIVLMRTPFQQIRERDTGSIRSRIADGFRFLWSQPFLRTCALLFGLGNFLESALVFTVVVVGRRQGLSAPRIGLLTAAFGACVLGGSVLSPFVRRRLSTRAILLLELWTGLGIAVFLVHPSVYALVGGAAPALVVIPSTDSVVHGYRIAITPDRLLGRSEAARAAISRAIAPLGPLLAGLLLATVSARATVAVFAAVSGLLAVWGTLSPSIRAAPDLAELATLPDA